MKRVKNIKNEEAVSPVIGVILMVVITVIIAAVLAVFAFGVGAPTQTQTASVKITSVNATNNSIWIQHYGGDNLRIVDTKFAVETLNSDNSILQTESFDVNPSNTGSFAAGDTMELVTKPIVGSTATYLILNGAPITFTSSGFVNLTYSGVESVRVTIIHTPSSNVLSKPVVRVN